MATSNCIIVASIDLGTTFSGYAYSLGTQDSKEIHLNRWDQESSYKAPSCVLLDKDGKFVAFGFDAEKTYSTRVTTKGTDSCEMYRHFKMILHEEKHISRSTQIQSVRGKQEYAITIFVHAVEYLKNHLLRTLQSQIKRDVTVTANDIKWVLTVPAIWSVKAKRFMREVAFRAGLIPEIESNKLVLCLEPEAASLYCRNMTTDVDKLTAEAVKLLHEHGTKYIIVDAGGGTVDICVHKILGDGRIKEIERASGGAFGGVRVDENFMSILNELMGKDFMLFLQNELPTEWLNLKMSFENQKGGLTLDPSCPDPILAIQLPFGIDTVYKKKTGADFIEKLNTHKPIWKVEFKDGKLLFYFDAVDRLFKESLKNIIQHVQEIERRHSDIKLILLNGGFGGCKVVHKIFRQTFSRSKGFHILCPPQPSAAIMKGAVMYGIDPQIIQYRVARKTYGIDVMAPFDPNAHPPERKVTDESGDWCPIFKPFVKLGETIPCDHSVKNTYFPFKPFQKSAFISILETDDSDVKFPDDPKLTEIGQLSISLQDTSRGRDRKIVLNIFFGLTEIYAEAVELLPDSETGDRAEIVFDFLSEE